ncbi:MAG: translation elongation factor Ts [Bdellovibrionales bacterium CG10_big_fil_rev_8_21_14_0_10_45_34]|nr:MAG: translation elongation factor Ts [Bdellovibrionales bacterium CG10_big_fil_rev_8_21_14_0_10_45_34]
MTITASAVKELREKTGAGMMDCKKALSEVDGDFEKAVDWLRQKGLSAAAKKAGRVAAEGVVSAYIHGEGRIGVLLEVNSETDFVARNDGFQDLVRDVAMHIAAMNPVCVRAEELPADLIERERQVLIGKAKETGKKPEMIEKIVEGQISKWKSEVCLLDQKFVKNPDKTIGQLLTDTIARLGENLVVRRFVRYELGEGIEKKSVDFAEEVAAQVKN